MQNTEKSQFVGTVERLKNNRTIEKQNTRTLMQTLLGCRKNCSECREDENEWEEASHA